MVQHSIACRVCNPQSQSMCLTGGERELERKIQREISRDPGQLRGLSWSGGLHLSQPRGLCLSLFLYFVFRSLSLSVQLDVQEPLKPPPNLHLPDPGQFSPAMRGHLWEFIPDASCSLHSLSFSLLPHLSLLPHNPPCPPTNCLSRFLISHTLADIFFLPYNFFNII